MASSREDSLALLRDEIMEYLRSYRGFTSCSICYDNLDVRARFSALVNCPSGSTLSIKMPHGYLKILLLIQLARSLELLVGSGRSVLQNEIVVGGGDALLPDLLNTRVALDYPRAADTVGHLINQDVDSAPARQFLVRYLRRGLAAANGDNPAISEAIRSMSPPPPVNPPLDEYRIAVAGCPLASSGRIADLRGEDLMREIGHYLEYTSPAYNTLVRNTLDNSRTFEFNKLHGCRSSPLEVIHLLQRSVLVQILARLQNRVFQQYYIAHRTQPDVLSRRSMVNQRRLLEFIPLLNLGVWVPYAWGRHGWDRSWGGILQRPNTPCHNTGRATTLYELLNIRPYPQQMCGTTPQKLVNKFIALRYPYEHGLNLLKDGELSTILEQPEVAPDFPCAHVKSAEDGIEMFCVRGADSKK